MSGRAFPVWADGALHPALTPVVAAEDQGFLLGLAVFETILVERGHAYFLEEHLARLSRGASVLGISTPSVHPARALAALILAIEADAALAEPRQFAARITLSKGVPGAEPTLVITAREPSVPPPLGAVVFVSSLRVLSDELAGVKTTSRLRYVAARAEAERYDAWEALLLNADGELAEGTVSNVFVARDGRLLTPGIDAGCLGGIVRQLIVGDVDAPVPVDVGRLPLSALLDADEVFLTNTTGRVIPVVRALFAPDGGVQRAACDYPGPDGALAALVRERIATLEFEDRERVETGH